MWAPTTPTDALALSLRQRAADNGLTMGMLMVGAIASQAQVPAHSKASQVLAAVMACTSYRRRGHSAMRKLFFTTLAARFTRWSPKQTCIKMAQGTPKVASAGVYREPEENPEIPEDPEECSEAIEVGSLSASCQAF